MMKSMTAMGRATLQAPFGQLIIEIQSVNKRFLDIQSFLPKEWSHLELELRKWVEKKVRRGSVSIRVELKMTDGAFFSLQPNISLVRQLKGAWQQIYQELGLPDSPIDPALLVQQPDLICLSKKGNDDEAYRHFFQEGVDKALEVLVAMRAREGKVLYQDIQARCLWLQQAIDFIASRATTAVHGYQKKLEERLARFGQGGIENEERILREVCLFAERVDISEEIVRFKSHLDHFLQVMGGTEEEIGKTLEFILQELSREINTLGSKNTDNEVARRVVQCKGELEKIREQVQNVE